MLCLVSRVLASLRFLSEEMEAINSMMNRLLFSGSIRVLFRLATVARKTMVYSHLTIPNEVVQ